MSKKPHSATTSRKQNAPSKKSRAKSEAHKSLAKEVSSLLSKRNSREANHRVSQLEGLLDRTVNELERLRTSKFMLPAPKRSNTSKTNKSSYRVALPDTHGCFVDTEACNAALSDISILQPEEIILLGDHLDAGGFLAEHMSLGYVAEADYSYQDDVVAANQFLDAVQAACPHAKITYLEGNHEVRIERWIMTQRLRNAKDAKYLRSVFGPDVVLHLEQRGIRFIARSTMYDGLDVPGSIKIGKCYFTHGSYTGKSCAQKHRERFGGNVVFGHVHSANVDETRTVSEFRQGAWTPGCLCKRQPLYMHTNPTSWVHGYHLQIVQRNGAFLPLNVPIISGESYLQPLLENLK